MTTPPVFKCAAIMVMAVNEVEELRETVDGLRGLLSSEDVQRIVIYSPSFVTAESKKTAREIENRCKSDKNGIPVSFLMQPTDDTSQAIRFIMDQQTDCSHFMWWASDSELPPEYAQQLITIAKSNPAALVKFTRMAKGGQQPKEKKLLVKWRDKAFCVFSQIIFCKAISDIAFMGHVIYPLPKDEIFTFDRKQTTSFTAHFLSWMLSRGTPIIELGAVAQMRRENKSTVSLADKFFMLGEILRCSHSMRRSRRKGRNP